MKVFVLSDVTHVAYEGDNGSIIGVYASRMSAFRKVQEIIPGASDAATEEWLVSEDGLSERYLYLEVWEVEE